MSAAIGRHQLILFDIDGTLIYTGGAGGKALSRAFADTCQIENGFAGIPLPGRTDTLILAEALARTGLTADASLLDRFQSKYFAFLADELAHLPDGAGVLPGVAAALSRLQQRPDTTIALLTGNYATSARLKLARFGLWSCFQSGAFAEDAETREGLVGIAVERARANGMPPVAARGVVVVGDTPLDVACGRANGALTIGVATGGATAPELVEAGADLVLEDLGDPRPFFEFLDSNR